MAFRPIRNYSAPGRYPATEDQARHLFRNVRQNGLAPAFAKVGNRVVFDPDRIDQLIAARAGDPETR